jgi:glycosyltransferase involved in cell wall biosynthesis
MPQTLHDHDTDVRAGVSAVKPLVSFVVPCYKLAHLLPQCVNSILAQTYREFEVLIMDNCSPDETPAVAASFHDSRVKHIRNETNLGHVRNYNKGIGLSRGKYVWVLSADDALRSPHVLDRFVGVMERESSVGFVFCRAVEVRERTEGGIVRWADCGEADRIWNGRTFLTRLIEHNRIVMSSGLVRKECYDKVALFPVDMPYACDWYLWCICALYNSVAYLSEPMVYCRVHAASLTTQYSREEGRICLGDEISVLWRIGREAELAGAPAVRDACKASLVGRLVYALKAGAKDESDGISQTGCDELLRSRVPDRNAEKELRALAYMGLGDEQYWDSAYDEAARSYWRALGIQPWRIESWTKYVLVRTGGAGRLVRRLLKDARPATQESDSRSGSASKGLPERRTRTIQFVVNTSAYGGAERHLLELIRRLDGPGVRPAILCLGPDFYTERLNGVPAMQGVVRCERQPASFGGWLKAFRVTRPDVVVFVYGWMWSFPWYAPVAAALAGVKGRFAIQHLAASPMPEEVEGRPLRKMLRRVLGGWTFTLMKCRISTLACKTTICVSNAVRNSLVSGYRFAADRTVTIRNGVSAPAWRPSQPGSESVRSRLGLTSDEFVLLCIARLSKEKGLEILLSAMAQLVGGGSAVKCIVVGDGPLKEQLSAQGETLGLSGHVFFAGFHEDVRPFLEAANAFVLTSHREGLPLSVLEAMASGLPCVVTNVGGNAEAVTHGREGLVVAPGSVDEVSRAIAYLVTHPQERAQMAQNARAKVREEFDLEKRMADIQRVILS